MERVKTLKLCDVTDYNFSTSYDHRSKISFDLKMPSSQESEPDEDGLISMENKAVPDNMKISTRYGMSKFEDWLSRRGLEVDYRF